MAKQMSAGKKIVKAKKNSGEKKCLAKMDVMEKKNAEKKIVAKIVLQRKLAGSWQVTDGRW